MLRLLQGPAAIPSLHFLHTHRTLLQLYLLLLAIQICCWLHRQPAYGGNSRPVHIRCRNHSQLILSPPRPQQPALH
jgi:hypothetical protein